MKLIKVLVQGLFGVFDHEIPLRRESGVTIVIGENGLGKTVVLESINAFFGENYKFFLSIEFKRFIFCFDNDEVWHLIKGKSASGDYLQVGRDGVGTSKIKYEKIYVDANGDSRRAIYERQKKLEFDFMRNRLYETRREDFYRMLAEREYLDKYMELELKNEKVNPPKWFKDGIKAVNVRLIETQRIISTKESGGESSVSTVTNCSNELKVSISKAVKESADITSGLDSTYPNRLVDKLRQRAEYSYAELNLALSKLDERRKYLSSAGLVVDAQDTDLARIEESQSDLIVLLKLYVDDSHEKLNPYEELAHKINLFMGVVNKRFKHKKLEVNKDEGFIFRSTVVKVDDRFAEIPHSKLSSGEQHELVLFFKLIFGSSAGDLILVDEPELSLHISWQNKFINDLKDVAAMNNFSAIIATHSPDIIADNWDLKVELVGVE